MNARSPIIYVAAFLVAGLLAFVIARSMSSSPTKNSGGDTVEDGVKGAAVTEETVHDFGVMAVGEKRSHTFVIRNAGQGPLELRNGGTSCSCTINLFKDEILAPGEEAEVTLEWKPTAMDSAFLKSATVNTTDPERGEIKLEIKGIVDALVNFEPESSWDVGSVPSGSTVPVTGRVFSRSEDAFTISIEHDDDIEADEPTPMTAEELADLEAKAGYTYRVVVPAGKLDAFTRTFTVKTDLRDGTSHQMKVLGHATGDLTLLPIGRLRFHERSKTITFDTIDRAQGKSVQVAMLIRDVPEAGLDFSGIVTDPDYLEVEVKKDESFRVAGKERHVVTFTYPAGSPADIRQGEAAATVKIPTGHPELGTVTFRLEYVAR